MSGEKTLIGVRGLAAALGLPKSWLIVEADEGRIPHLRVGARRLFDLQAVRRALADRAATSTAQVCPATVLIPQVRR